MVTLRLFAGCVMDQKHIVWATASYVLLVHGFNRLRIAIVFPNSEAVTGPGICYIRAYPLFYAFCFKIKKECRRWDLNPHDLATTGT